MIVRDEAHVVREALDSVAPHIDHWVIVDTGSTDATIETIRSHMAGLGIPGEVHERPWRDFGTNRTEALELCRGKGEYAWMLDADDLVVGDLDLTGLVADSYILRYGEDFRYWRKQIFRDGLRWRYEGVVHEYPRCLDPATERRLDGDYHLESRRIGARNTAPDKYERDIRLLEEALERNPDDERAQFYLAQSHFDAGDHERALEAYSRRARMGGWDEEVFFSLLRRASCLTVLDEPWEAALAAYLEAFQSRPSRAEPLYEIARHYRLADQFALGHLFAKRAAEIPFPEGDSLFVTTDVYAWRAVDELSICAYYTGRHEESFELCTDLLESAALPEGERERVQTNRDVCVPWLEEGRAEYPAELVARLAERVADASEAPEVTLTITSCRRPALFERTVNSFLRCCTDLERIGRFVCVDNGSADLDRARMRERYPFFEFVLTDPEAERHAESMNRILELVQSPHWIHLEDDWQFFWRGPYVERALAVLADDEAIAQVAFNRNYGETLEDRATAGGTVRRTRADGRRYRVHDHLDPETPAWHEYLESLPAGVLTAAYWPHFTLRPSLMRTAALKRVGSFVGGGGHFELEFARRYAAAGMQTAFFDQINCLHTGRLTSQEGSGPAQSAYELVGDGEHPAHPRTVETESVVDERLEIAVINLDRRPDRWESFQAAMRRAAGPGFAERCLRFPGIDGVALEETEEIRHLFRGNDFAFRRGIVGCALSHIALWRAAAERADGELFLIFEDDARPGERFDRELAAVCAELRDEHPSFDVALLGYFPNRPVEEEPESGAGPGRLRPMRWERHLGGSWAYVVSPAGARRLLELVELDGVQNGIDTFKMLHGDELESWECDPPLVTAPLALAGSGVDSDIQDDFESLPGRPRALAALAPSLTVGELRLDVEPRWPCVAATIAAEGDELRLIVRTAGEAENGEPATLEYLVALDESLEVDGVEFLPDGANGSAPSGVEVDGGRLFVVPENGSQSGHRFVLRDSDQAPVAASPAFRLVDGGEETCGGLARRGEKLVISFGVGGQAAGLALLDADEALGLLEPC
jgi:GR25 family glycosyltransferase involved in LPS biosynthesis/tetratricopeptide (TPR) repeat protein